VRFVVFTPRAKTGFDVTLSLLSLFVALVLVLFPDEADRERFRWIALGFAVLGVGGLVFGYLTPVLDNADDLQRSMYCSLVVRITALAPIAVGISSSAPPRMSRKQLLTFVVCAALLAAFVFLIEGELPTLVRIADLEAAAQESTATLDGLTTAHWLLSSIPFGLALAAVIGVVRHALLLAGREWLAVATVLLAGSQLHTMFWPSAYSPVLTTASILRLAFTLVVAFGAVFALRQVADERNAVLAAERELGQRLAELTRLRADYTAMVAHELSTPAAVLRGYAAMLATGDLDRSRQIEAAEAIRGESDLIRTLIDDVRAAASVERDDFNVKVGPTVVGALLADAATYAHSLEGEHPATFEDHAHCRVDADQDRIAQVLRNLVSNACRHTPPGTPVTLRAVRSTGRVRIEVADSGPGIHPDDVDRIFEKFGRGRDAEGNRRPGVGLGLYLSRRIIEAHGGELRMRNSSDGATFWFELPMTDR
jgi:signal transduction histidine kinase